MERRKRKFKANLITVLYVIATSVVAYYWLYLMFGG